MEQETLFTASKWEILKLLAEQPLSPIELAAKSNTSVANVSQQLRLLEMAGLVRSERIPNREKGQPRILYSLAGNNSYLIATTDSFVDKKLLQLSAYNKIIMKIWFYHQRDLHYTLEKAFWQIEEHLPVIDALALEETTSDDKVSLIIFTRDDALKGKIKTQTITDPQGTKRTVTFTTAHPDKPAKEVVAKELYWLYDPGTIIPGLNNEEGSEQKVTNEQNNF